MSSSRVFGEVPPVRLRFATAAACLPSALRVFFGMCAIVRFFFAAPIAFLTFLRAAARCFFETMLDLPLRSRTCVPTQGDGATVPVTRAGSRDAERRRASRTAAVGLALLRAHRRGARAQRVAGPATVGRRGHRG